MLVPLKLLGLEPKTEASISYEINICLANIDLQFPKQNITGDNEMKVRELFVTFHRIASLTINSKQW